MTSPSRFAERVLALVVRDSEWRDGVIGDLREEHARLTAQHSALGKPRVDDVQTGDEDLLRLAWLVDGLGSAVLPPSPPSPVDEAREAALPCKYRERFQRSGRLTRCGNRLGAGAAQGEDNTRILSVVFV